MKKILILAAIGLSGLVLFSCKADVENMKDIRLMPIRFKPLSRNDMTLVGNLQAESTISYTMKKAGDKVLIALTAEYMNNRKMGLVNNQYSKTTVVYSSVGAGEAAVLGDVIDMNVDQSVTATLNGANAKVLQSLVRNRDRFLASYRRTGNSLYYRLYMIYKDRVDNYGAGEGPNFAYYALIEKYPDVDYFINVRFDRKTVQKGNIFTETVIARADGIKLKTD